MLTYFELFQLYRIPIIPCTFQFTGITDFKHGVSRGALSDY
jgi:hypothetical protein